MATTATKAVRDLVLENPSAARVFEKFGIDYCCGGSQTLDDACIAAKHSVQEVTAELEKPVAGPPEKDWRTASLAELAQYIVDKHHAFTQAELTRLGDLLAKVAKVHGTNHPELARIQSVFEGMSHELRMHMTKEEQILFPFIGEMEEAARVRRRAPVAMFGTVQNPIAAMIMEHEDAGQALEKMRELTSGYTLPGDACTSYQLLYQGLPAFEADMHQHIHLENNILFPRAIELESSLS